MSKCGFDTMAECVKECKFYDTCTRNPYTKDEKKIISTDKLRELVTDHDQKTRKAVIEEIREAVWEIYICKFYCMEDMCDKKPHTVDRCIKCLYESIDKALERRLNDN